jgi:cytidylate kinase
MNPTASLERCHTFIHCNFSSPGQGATAASLNARKCAITISRQSGCGAHAVAEKLAALLQARSPAGGPPWTVFDQNLMDHVLREHHLPGRLAQFMPEDSITAIEDIMTELFGERPPAWRSVEHTAETILNLVEIGRVILLGRGGNVVTARLPGVLHVRLIAPLETRLKQMQQFEELTRRAALERIRREDLGRKRYLQKYFGKDIDDPLLYHVVINTGLVSLDDAAQMIAGAFCNLGHRESRTK